MNKLILAVSFILLSLSSFGQKKYTINQIPNPKAKGENRLVSNPDGVLNNENVLNTLLTDLERETKIEFAVVVVKDFDDNAEEFDFALSLFRKWGIGKKDKNNGLLLFVSVDRKKYRFITGYGIEGDLPDVTLTQLANANLVPAFKKKQYSQGVEDVTSAIINRLTNSENTTSSPPPPALLMTDEVMTPSHSDARSMPEQAVESSINGFASPAQKTGVISKTFRSIGFMGLLCMAVIVLTVLSIKKILSYSKTQLKTIDQSRIKFSKKIAGNGCFIVFAFIFINFFVFSSSGDFFSYKNVSSIFMVLFVVMGILLYSFYTKARISLSALYFDDESYQNALKKLNRKFWWFFFANPLLLILVINQRKKQRQLTDRFEPVYDSQNQLMQRLNRDENVDGQPYLNKGQYAEEKLGVNDYDIWLSDNKKEYKIVVHQEDNYHDFDDCTKCSFKTLSKPKVIVTKQATYSNTGKSKEVLQCANCNHEQLLRNIVIPIRRESSSSSGGSSSSGRSSSSSSSRSSFGGGSSGGGGSGGSW